LRFHTLKLDKHAVAWAEKSRPKIKAKAYAYVLFTTAG
jgi:hypothetical protein